MRLATLTLRLSDEPIVALPTDIAHEVGLEEGDVQVILGDHSLTLIPSVSSPDYTTRWIAMAQTLREQGMRFGLSSEDRRDASYWEVVNPLFEEAERLTSST